MKEFNDMVNQHSDHAQVETYSINTRLVKISRADCRPYHSLVFIF